MDDTGQRAGLYVITRGTRVGWSVSGVSFLVSASERVMSLTRPIQFLVGEREIVSTFVEIRFEFVSTECESVVRRTNTSKSES